MKRYFEYSTLAVWVICTSLGGPLALTAKTGKFRAIIHTNPSKEIVIAFDLEKGERPVLHYGTKDEGSNADNYPLEAKPYRVSDYKGMNTQFIRLKGLKPHTNYYFVVKDSRDISQRLFFRTLPDDGKTPLSIIAGGDSRSNDAQRRITNQLVKLIRPDLVLFGGDFTPYGFTSQWKAWFDDWQLTIGDDGLLVPLLIARGNHEFSNELMQKLWAVPNPDIYYAVNLNKNLARAYSLNTEMAIPGAQTEWLREDMKKHASNVQWRLVQYHKPMRPHVEKKDEGEMQYRFWAPLFEKHKVDLVVECDAHVVKTTWPIVRSDHVDADEGFIRNDQRGVVYTGEGTWAVTRDDDDVKKWTRRSDAFFQVKWIQIYPDKITLQTLRALNYTGKAQLVDDTDRFRLPKGVVRWEHDAGSMITIKRK